MTEDDLRKIQAAIVATDPQDVSTVELLKEQFSRAQQALADAQPKALAPAAAAGAPVGEGGGSLPPVRKVAAVAGMAPAKGVAGLMDMAGEGGRLVAEKSGVPIPPFPHLVPQVDRLTDQLAGEPVPMGMGRAVFEGAITGPLMGVKTPFAKGPGGFIPAGTGPATVAGGAGAGAAESVNEAGGHPLASLLAAALAGKVAGGAANNARLRPDEIRAKGALTRALEGATPGEFAAAKKTDAMVRGEGLNPMPGQTFPVELPGLQDLQGALLRSSAAEAPGFRQQAATLPRKTQMMVEELQRKGGQTPRSDDDMADRIQQLAEAEAARGPKAVNDATRPLYNDPLGTKWTIDPVVRDRIEVGLDEAIFKHRGTAAATALEQAKAKIMDATGIGEMTPKLLSSLIQSIKQELPVYKEIPQSANYVRKVVTDTIRPLEELVAKHAPDLGRAPKVQSALREDLPTGFNETFRQSRTSTGTEAAIKAVEKRPEVLRMIADRDPLLAQEIMQRQLDGAITKATQLRNDRPAIDAGMTLRKDLEASGFMKNLDILLPGKPDAQEGFRRTLEAAAVASRPIGHSGAAPITTGAPDLVRGVAGTQGQTVGVIGKTTGYLLNILRNNSTIRVLQRPDVIERLEVIAKMPKPRLTAAAITAAVPQLFEEQQ